MDQVRGSRSGVASIGDTVPLSYTIIGSDDSSADNAAAAAAAVPADGLVTAESAAQQRSVETSAAGVQSIVASGVDDATLAAIQAADVTNDVFPDQYVSLGIMDLTPLTPGGSCSCAVWLQHYCCSVGLLWRSLSGLLLRPFRGPPQQPCYRAAPLSRLKQLSSASASCMFSFVVQRSSHRAELMPSTPGCCQGIDWAGLHSHCTAAALGAALWRCGGALHLPAMVHT